MSSLKKRLNKTASNKEQEIIVGSDKILKVKDELDRAINYLNTNQVFNEINDLNPGIDQGDEFYNELNSISQKLETIAREIKNFTL
jgi:vacuolar-type H+-ATPase subunit I/STV1